MNSFKAVAISALLTVVGLSAHKHHDHHHARHAQQPSATPMQSAQQTFLIGAAMGLLSNLNDSHPAVTNAVGIAATVGVNESRKIIVVDDDNKAVQAAGMTSGYFIGSVLGHLIKAAVKSLATKYS